MRIRVLPAWFLVFLAVAFSAASDIPKNTKLEIRLDETLSSDTSHTGQRFRATLNRGVSAGQLVVLEKGALVEGIVKYAEPTFDYQQPGELELELISVTSGGKLYSVRTNTIMLHGKPVATDPRTGRPMDSGSRAGDVMRGTIGTIAGGNRDATTTIPGTDLSVGASSGGNSRQVILPAKTKLTFNLAAASASGPPQ
jgi:hypothetical protein